MCINRNSIITHTEKIVLLLIPKKWTTLPQEMWPYITQAGSFFCFIGVDFETPRPCCFRRSIFIYIYTYIYTHTLLELKQQWIWFWFLNVLLSINILSQVYYLQLGFYPISMKTSCIFSHILKKKLLSLAVFTIFLGISCTDTKGSSLIRIQSVDILGERGKIYGANLQNTNKQANKQGNYFREPWKYERGNCLLQDWLGMT